jgi:hypothetical protein
MSARSYVRQIAIEERRGEERRGRLHFERPSTQGNRNARKDKTQVTLSTV